MKYLLPIATTILAVAPFLAFAKSERKTLLRRDKWTCQNDECIGNYLEIGPLDWSRGWNVNAAHYPDSHKPYEDHDINNGRCLCVTCHIIEEIERNNYGGASLLYTKQTIHNKEWLQANNWKGENGVEKIPFTWFIDWVRSDELGRQGLAQAFAEKYLQYETSQ